MSRDRIYPVPVKPPSAINSWPGWPEDVYETLWAWNHRKVEAGQLVSRLSFGRRTGVFKCDCGEFCLPHRGGAAVLDGVPLCDDCLIARARAEL